MGAAQSQFVDNPLVVEITNQVQSSLVAQKLKAGAGELRSVLARLTGGRGPWTDTLLLGGCGLTLFYFYLTRDWRRFSSKGVPQSNPIFPLGSPCTWAAFAGKQPFGNMFGYYAGTALAKERFFGTFFCSTPQLVVVDKNLAKQILIKDFDHFVDRRDLFPEGSGTYGGQISEKMLFALKTEEWKQVRAMMSPVFTSGKLKGMMPHLVKVGEQMEEYITNAAEKGDMLEAKNMFGMFTLDSIATSGFGIETNSFQDPDNLFRIMALKLIRAPGYSSSWDMIIMMFNIFVLPKWFTKMFNISFFVKGTLEFFADIVKKAMKHREATGERRNDIIDLMVDQIKEDGKKLDGDKEVIMIAQAIGFFFAGFDTSALGLSSLVGCLVNHPEVQERVREEILEVMGSSDTLTFDHLYSMKYLDHVINESLRFTNVVPLLERVCTKEYKIPDSDYVIQKGEIVELWNGPMLQDTENIHNVNNFDPENFSSEHSLDKFSIFTFGQGPRNCVGMRYAMLTIKVAIVHTLRRIKLSRCAKTQEKMEVDPASVSGDFKGGVWFLPEIIQDSKL